MRKLPSLKKMKLSNKSQEKGYEIKIKLYAANKNCNDWKLQIHCNKIEWLNTRNHNELENPFYVSFKKLYIEDNN